MEREHELDAWLKRILCRTPADDPAKSSTDTGPARAYGRTFSTSGSDAPSPETAWKQLGASVEEHALAISGSCPACTHWIDDFVSLSPEWVKHLRPVGEQVITVVQCNCTHAHAGRPDDAIGCGAIAVVTVSLTPKSKEEDPQQNSPRAEVISARRASARDRSWDDEAGKWEQAMSTRLSETAEKWGQTVAALFGLFGLGLVLESDRVEKVVSSSDTWPWWVLAGLLAVAATVFLVYWGLRHEETEPRDDAFLVTGTSMATLSLGCILLGYFGDPPKAGVTFGIMAGIAVGLALAATAFAGLAAQGSPKWVSYLTGNRMRALRIERADRSVRDLRRARVTTSLAVIALASALAVLWYASAEPPGKQKVRLVIAGGLTPCGELLSRAGPGIAIDPDGEADSREEFALDDVTHVEAVDSCSE